MAHEYAVSLRAHGQTEGCRVAIIGDMTPRAIACYLAVVLVGGAVVSVAPSFSAEEIASRLALAQTSLVITQVCTSIDRKHVSQLSAAGHMCKAAPMTTAGHGPGVLQVVEG